MLRSMKDLDDYAVGATDGVIGSVKDFLFDDQAWAVRYFVVETGTWLTSREVLISPISIDRPDWEDKLLAVSITREQVKNSPDVWIRTDRFRGSMKSAICATTVMPTIGAAAACGAAICIPTPWSPGSSVTA
jgi:hypothetical protein